MPQGLQHVFDARDALEHTSPYSDDGDFTNDFAVGYCGPSQAAAFCYSINITEDGIAHFKTYGANAFICGDYCNSTLMASAWAPYAFAGYLGEEEGAEDCANQATLWQRLGCSQWPYVDKTLGRAIDGIPGTVGFAPLDNMYASQGTDWTANCLGCQQLGAMFTNAGAFGDTAFCETLDELSSQSIVLRGYVSQSDYPEVPSNLDTLTAMGGQGRRQRYATHCPNGYALYDWVEIDGVGGTSASHPFAFGSVPPDWDGWLASSGAFTDDTYESADLEPEVTVSGIGPFTDTDCADVIVYAAWDSLAEPVRAQIQANAPTLKVRKILAPFAIGGSGRNQTAQACRQAIAGVLRANADWNENCGSFPNPPCGGRYYPTSPGPEVYIVGNTDISLVGDGRAPGIQEGSLGHVSEACGGHDCRSDLIIYDTNGDGFPEGPVSRIPAATVAEVLRSVAAADDWNAGRYLDPGKTVVILSGDKWNGKATTFPTNDLTTIASDLQGIGLRPVPMLKESAYPACNIAANHNAFKLDVNTGVREIVGMGTFTWGNEWPGMFATSTASQYTKRQRVLAWLPGCSIHNIWTTVTPGYDCYGYESGNIARQLMFNDVTKTMLAASVANMDAGKDGAHSVTAHYISAVRQIAATATPEKTVARSTYDAVMNILTEHPELADHALTLSAWGSYVRIPHSSPGGGGGGCPTFDVYRDGSWEPENTILGRASDGNYLSDNYHLNTNPTAVTGFYNVRVRENEQEETTLDNVVLATVDHAPGVAAVPVGPEFVLGNLEPALRVVDSGGVDRTNELGEGGIGISLVSGDTLYVELARKAGGSALSTTGSASPSTESGDGGFVMDSMGKDLPPDEFRADNGMRSTAQRSPRTIDEEVLATTGLLLQVPDGAGGWTTVVHEYPRDQFAESVFDSIDSDRVRIVAVGAHRIRYLGRVVPAAGEAPQVHRRAPVQASHSRLGDVRLAVSYPGSGITNLVPGDTLNLRFTATAVPEGKVRDFFFISRGVYSALPFGASAGASPRIAPTFQFGLGSARPNPSSGRVTFGYTLARSTTAILRLYNVTGRLVRTVVQGQQEAGPHEVLWDGTDDHGARAAAGVYFYRLQADDWSSERKLVVIQR